MNLWIEVDNLLWTSLVAVGWRWPETPRWAAWRGAAVAVLNTYKKKFLKKF